MKRCPITYDIIDNELRYSALGVKRLSRQLKDIKEIPLTAAEMRREAQRRAVKMSIQGVQPKISAILRVKESRFELVDLHGQYIIKPQNSDFAELPENESLTMKMAESVDIEVPVFGLVYCKDNSFSYFIKRFDRVGRKGKLALEDFAQLSGKHRDTKYDASIELLIKVIDKYCTYPMVDRIKLFMRIIFNFLVGNEDMHIKNYSLISRNNKVELSPAYDLVNSTIVLTHTLEESALPLRGKKNRLNKEDFIEYLASERLSINSSVIHDILNQFKQAMPGWIKLVEISFLSDNMKEAYINTINRRRKVLDL